MKFSLLFEGRWPAACLYRKLFSSLLNMYSYIYNSQISQKAVSTDYMEISVHWSDTGHNITVGTFLIYQCSLIYKNTDTQQFSQRSERNHAVLNHAASLWYATDRAVRNFMCLGASTIFSRKFCARKKSDVQHSVPCLLKQEKKREFASLVICRREDRQQARAPGLKEFCYVLFRSHAFFFCKMHFFHAIYNA